MISFSAVLALLGMGLGLVVGLGLTGGGLGFVAGAGGLGLAAGRSASFSVLSGLTEMMKTEDKYDK